MKRHRKLMSNAVVTRTLMTSSHPRRCFSTTFYRSRSHSNSMMANTIPTMHFQKSMPKLPVPNLEKTTARFKDAVRPLLSQNDFQEFASVIDSFEKNDGARLHKKLLDYAKENSHTSYITNFWNEMYLTDRRPIVFTHTPVVGTVPPPDLDPKNPCAQTVRCTNTIISALKFKEALDKGKLYPDIYHGDPKNANNTNFDRICKFTPQQLSYYAAYFQKSYPLDMSQYKNLFCSTRVPKPGRDELIVNPSSKNVVFLRHGHIYSVDVLSERGEIIDPKMLAQNIEYILQDTSSPAFPAGAFTTTDRDTWTKVRDSMLKLEENEETLRRVNGAIFVVSLEDFTGAQTADVHDGDFSRVENLVKNILIGDGRNNWFDKSINMIFLKDGTFALQFEHSWGDGISVVRFINEVCKDSFENPALPYSATTDDFLPITRSPSVVQKEIKRSRIKLDEECQEICRKVMLEFDEKARGLQLSVFKGPRGLGKNFAKAAKISPDSLMQLCIQLGYFQISNGKTAPTYESCTTAGFKHGRTETVRACTMETKNFSEAFFASNTPKDELQRLLKACSEKHQKLTLRAATGQGCDRHLFAMKQLALAESDQLPELFRHEIYNRVHQFVLSTSTVPSEYCLVGAFCPVVPDGLGVGYEIEDETLGFSVTSYKKDFCREFTGSMSDIIERLQRILL